ncbi:hypothetical protein [Planococcus sp. YIM B11945]|uniref:hypothetical protein n=1 Tax=Planococcus sp. YIM B11945 TaxID=3435410 RepID=UPI003D7D8AAC
MPLIDPFLMQLFIVPISVIGLGLVATAISKKTRLEVIIGPIVTLLLNMLYEVWYSFSFDPNIELSFSSSNIINPLITFFLSWILINREKSNENSNSNKTY